MEIVKFASSYEEQLAESELLGAERDPCMQAVGMGMAGEDEEIPRFGLPVAAHPSGQLRVIFQLGTPPALAAVVSTIVAEVWNRKEPILLGEAQREVAALVTGILRSMVSRGELTRSIHGGGAWTYMQHGLPQEDYERRTRL